jgi:hypothetical protein
MLWKNAHRQVNIMAFDAFGPSNLGSLVPMTKNVDYPRESVAKLKGPRRKEHD